MSRIRDLARSLRTGSLSEAAGTRIHVSLGVITRQGKAEPTTEEFSISKDREMDEAAWREGLDKVLWDDAVIRHSGHDSPWVRMVPEIMRTVMSGKMWTGEYSRPRVRLWEGDVLPIAVSLNLRAVEKHVWGVMEDWEE